jgi:hypothetical protein
MAGLFNNNQGTLFVNSDTIVTQARDSYNSSVVNHAAERGALLFPGLPGRHPGAIRSAEVMARRCAFCISSG